MLDEWFEHEVKPRLRGRAFEVRYADDAVLVFEHEDDAQRVLGVLAKRLEKYGLRLHPDKTRMVEFCRPSKSQRGGSQGASGVEGCRKEEGVREWRCLDPAFSARIHGAAMTGAVECRYYGRDFTAEEMALLRALIAGPALLNRPALSKEFCRRIGWFKPDGGLKDMMARVTMLAMHRDALITLPARQGRHNRPGPIAFGPHTEPPLFPAPTTLDEVRPLDLRPVVRATREGKLWNEFVARYHYLGYKTLVGAQMRYAVHDRGAWPLAMLGFSTAAWKLAPRDNFIGWSPQLREKNLPLVVDNPRFLILPWVTIPNLGSHILALIRRRLPQDWTERYNTTPLLIEALALDCFSILPNSSLLGKVMKIRHLLELGIFLPVPLRRARWT